MYLGITAQTMVSIYMPGTHPWPSCYGKTTTRPLCSPPRAEDIITRPMAAMDITRCGIHGFHEVLGIDTDHIRFYWTLHSDIEDAQQTAYRIVVATDSAVLDEPDAPTPSSSSLSRLVWDSGRVASDAQRDVPCQPEGGFASASFHYWRVTVWDQDGHAFQGPTQEFFTAYPRSSRLLPPYSMNQTYVGRRFTEGPKRTSRPP